MRCLCGLLFFFSSRRRHTRFDCDWSSDVCSSDLRGGVAAVYVESNSFYRIVTADEALHVLVEPRVDSLLAQLRHHVDALDPPDHARSEEHTSELQSQSNLVCRLLLEKKKI